MMQMYICCRLFGLSAVWLVRSTSLRLLQENYLIYLFTVFIKPTLNAHHLSYTKSHCSTKTPTRFGARRRHLLLNFSARQLVVNNCPTMCMGTVVFSHDTQF